MQPWMIERPQGQLDLGAEVACQKALKLGDAALIPPHVPRWLVLDWLAQQGWLLHGSDRADLTEFEPRAPHDLSPDDFSKQRAVYAASDGLWAIMYALRDRTRVNRMLNMALQVWGPGGWSGMNYFLSFAPRDQAVSAGRDLLRAGFIYVLPAAGFLQMPPYLWPGLGEVCEPHWVCPAQVRPVLCVPVTPADFPLPVRIHDAAHIDALSQSDPWGFPWLNPD
jgi:hypothetical protein